MIEFILARYNYWIVIILMMTGLYIVFSRGNLIKTIVGLNLFQTSVFIFYITIGKVAGGTAPILIGGHGDEGDHHGGGHDGTHGEGAEGIKITHESQSHGESVETHGHADPLSVEDAAGYVTGERANALEPNEPGSVSTDVLGDDTPNLHDVPEITGGNSLLTPSEPGATPTADMAVTGDLDPIIIEETAEAGQTASHAAEAGAQGVDAAGHAVDIIYSNPLPHVLILTAIVVGVATTAVGLAIAVRIREAYGTIEEDALERLDNEAEFGRNGVVEAGQ